MKKFTVLVLLAIIVSMCSTAMALDPMGAPSAGLTQGQKSSGIEYSYSKQKLGEVLTKKLRVWNRK